MVLISLYNNAYRIRNQDYKVMKSAFLRYKHSTEEEKKAAYDAYEKALHTATKNGHFVGEIHGPFVYGLESHFMH